MNPINSKRNWLFVALAGLVVALVGGAFGSAVSDLISGAVQESQIHGLEREQDWARDERDELRRQIFELQRQVSSDIGDIKAGIEGLKGEIRGLRSEKNR